MTNFLQGYAFFGSGQEWLIVLLVILVLFGGSKIPQLMRGVGRGISEFQEGIREGKDKIQQSLREEPRTEATEK